MNPKGPCRFGFAPNFSWHSVCRPSYFKLPYLGLHIVCLLYSPTVIVLFDYIQGLYSRWPGTLQVVEGDLKLLTPSAGVPSCVALSTFVVLKSEAEASSILDKHAANRAATAAPPEAPEAPEALLWLPLLHGYSTCSYFWSHVPAFDIISQSERHPDSPFEKAILKTRRSSFFTHLTAPVAPVPSF